MSQASVRPSLTGLQWHILSRLAAGSTLREDPATGRYWLSSPHDPAERVFPLSHAKLWTAGYIDVDLALPHQWHLTALGRAMLAAEMTSPAVSA